MNTTLKELESNIQDQQLEFDAYHENINSTIETLKRTLHLFPKPGYFRGLESNITEVERKVENLERGNISEYSLVIVIC